MLVKCFGVENLGIRMRLEPEWIKTLPSWESTLCKYVKICLATFGAITKVLVPYEGREGSKEELLTWASVNPYTPSYIIIFLVGYLSTKGG